MISFVPFVEYKMDKCYLTEAECVGLIVMQMATWETDDSTDVIDAIFENHWSHRFNDNKNQTEFMFGGYRDESYKFTAIFKFTPDRENVKLIIYVGSPKNDVRWYEHTFDDDEEMTFVDFLTYKDDPKRLEDYNDWNYK